MRKHTKHTTTFLIAAGLIAAVFSAQCKAAESLVYDSPTGVSYEVTANGLSRISVDGKQVASGHLLFVTDDDRFDQGPNAVSHKLIGKELTTVSDNKAIVRHEHQDAVITYTYEFDGEDVTVSARVENNHPSERLDVACFKGLTFDFGKAPKGYLPNHHWTYTRAQGLRYMHPGHFLRLGASYGVVEQFGMAVFPANREIRRTATLFDWDWNRPDDERHTDPKRTLMHFVHGPVPPLGARTFRFGIRVSPNTDWKHLLEPYRAYLHAQLGEQQYVQSDYRPLLMEHAAASEAHITKDNPYGFHHRRYLHTRAGVEDYSNWQLAAAKALGAQGLIEWTPAGVSKRGAMYRTDFDVWPPEITEHWPYLRERFEEAGVRLGFTSRPGQLTVRGSWEKDRVLQVHPDEAGQVANAVHRFKNMMDRGFTISYMDCFGNNFQDLALAQQYRKALGPDFHGYSEYTADVFLPYFGVYVHMNGFDPDKGAASTMWTPFYMWKIFLWLYPDAAIFMRPDDRLFDRLDADGRVALADFVYKNGLMLLVQTRFMTDHELAGRIKETVRKYMDEEGMWKE